LRPNGIVEPPSECGKELLPQCPLKALGDVEIARDSLVGSNWG